MQGFGSNSGHSPHSPSQACTGVELAPKLMSMRHPMELKISKSPFFVGDLLLLVIAYFIAGQSRFPAQLWHMLLMFLCVVAGAALGVLPFILEYRLASKLAEAQELTTVVDQIQQLQSAATQISQATSQWQGV